MLDHSLKDIALKLEEGQQFLEKNATQIRQDLKNYTCILKEVGKCPLCKSNIDQKSLDDIMKEYKYEGMKEADNEYRS